MRLLHSITYVIGTTDVTNVSRCIYSVTHIHIQIMRNFARRTAPGNGATETHPLYRINFAYELRSAVSRPSGNK
jgi:hypothetical protein